MQRYQLPNKPFTRYIYVWVCTYMRVSTCAHHFSYPSRWLWPTETCSTVYMCAYVCICICVHMCAYAYTSMIKSNKNKAHWTNNANNICANGKRKKWKTVVEWRRRVIVWEIHSIFEPPAFRMSPSSKMNGAWEKSTAELMACVPKTHVGELTIVTARTRLQPNILFGAIGAGTKRRS